MYQKSFFPLIFIGLATSSLAMTDAEKSAGAEFIAAIKEEANQNTKNPTAREHGDPQYMISQFQMAVTQGNSRKLEQMLDNYSSSFTSEKSIQSLIKLKEAYREELELHTRVQVVELEAILKRAQEAVTQAQSPEQLDAVLEELSKRQTGDYEQGYDQSNAQLRQINMRLTYAKPYVIAWQEYLQAKKSGDVTHTVQAMQSLSRQETPLLPRSVLLARLEQERAGLGDPVKIVAGIKNLEEMEPALIALEKIKQGGQSEYSNTPLADSIQRLSYLVKIYQDCQAGLPLNLENMNQSSYGEAVYYEGKANLGRLKAELFKYVLPRYLGAAEGTKAKEGEDIQQFMNRMLADAKSRDDLAACEKIKLAQRYFSGFSQNSTADTDALRDYHAGQNLLTAGQYVLAVVSYQKALKSGYDFLPVKQIGQQLESIQRDHPKEYEQGLNESLNPRYPFDYPGMRRDIRDPRATSSSGLTLPAPGGESAAPAKTEAKAAESPKTKSHAKTSGKSSAE